MARPLKPQRFHILLALADGPRHGSEVMRQVLRLTDGEVRLWPTMLYSTLEDLLEKGWIEELIAARERPPDASDRKRFYRLTGRGRRVLADETERLARLVEVARRLSAAPGGETA